MKSDIEIVKVNVDNFDDLFNKYDSDDISDSLALYIENRCSRTTKNKLRIIISTKEELNKLEKDKIVTSIRSHYGLENKYLDIEIKKMNKVYMMYFFVGLLTVFVGNILSLGTYIPEVIDIIGGFIIYESAFNLFFKDNELDLRSYLIKKIGSAHIDFEITK